MANEFKVKKGLIVEGTDGELVNVQASNGQLFSVEDNLTGSVFAASDISGVPIFDVNSSGTSYFNDRSTLVLGMDEQYGSNYFAIGWGGTTNGYNRIIAGKSNGGSAPVDSIYYLAGTARGHYWRVNGSSSDSMNLNPNGNLGIGNTNPQAKLHTGASLNLLPTNTSIAVNGGTTFRFTGGGDGNSDYGSYIAGVTVGSIRTLQLGSRNTGSDELAMTISQGKVGIGTTGPIDPLNVQSTGINDYAFRIFRSTSATQGLAGFYEGSSNQGQLYLLKGDNTAGVLLNSSGDSYFNGGSVGIGQTNPSAKLYVEGAIKSRNLVASSPASDTRRMINVASYQGGGATDTGKFIISLPTPGTYEMMKMKISGWQYDEAWDLTVSGYAHPTAGWTQIGGSILTGNPPFSETQVRLAAATGTNSYYVILGTTTSFWDSYTSVVIDADTFYSDGLASTGWDMHISTSDPASLTHDFTLTNISKYGSNEARIGGIVVATNAAFTSNLDSYFSGDVGIGTTGPQGRLDVVSGNSQMTFSGASSDRTYMQFKHNAVPVDGEELTLLDFSGYNSASQDTRYVILTSKAEDVTDGSEDGSLTFQTMKGGTATSTLVLRSGNVGIGNNNPGQKLDVTGKIRVTDDIILAQTNGRIDFDNGVTSGALRFWSTSGNTERMRIEAGGDVGIGTTNPGVALQVSGLGSENTYRGVLRIDNNSSAQWAGISFPDDADATDSAANNYYFIGRGSLIADRTFSIHIPRATDYGNGGEPLFGVYSTGSVSLLTVQANTGSTYIKGNTGIGITSPFSKLTVAGDINLGTNPSATPYLEQGDYAIRWGYEAGNNYAIKTDYKAYTNTVGNSYTYTRLQLNWHTGIEIGASKSYGGTRFFNDAPGSTAPIQLMSIGDGDNNVRIVNTLFAAGGIITNGTSTRNKISVWDDLSAYTLGMGSGYTFGGLNDYAMTFSMSDSEFRGWYWGDTAHSNAQGAMSLTTRGLLNVASFTRIGYGESSTVAPVTYMLDVSGTIRATGDVIAYSDARVKDNVVTIENALDKVTQLRGVSYTRNDVEDKTAKIGVIAQEVLEVLPEVVQQDDEGKYSVAYGNMVGLLIEAIKEQDKKIERLEGLVELMLKNK